MADTKISALTDLAAADIAGADEIAIVDTSVTTTKKASMTSLSARTETMTNKTLTTPVLGGTPAVAGALGYDTTLANPTGYGGITAVAGVLHKTIATGVGTQTLTNSVSTDQDFTSMFTFPANSIYTNKVYRVSVFVEHVAGVSTAVMGYYLKLGSTKVATMTGANQTNSVTRSSMMIFYIFGRAAAGAAANVSTTIDFANVTSSIANPNNLDQPVALATNGTLTVNFGVVWDATGSTETLEQQAFIIEELN